MRKPTNGCYYGDRKAVYVQILHPERKPGERKHLVVYGKELKEVIHVVDRALGDAFGRTSSGRPKGRPPGRKEKGPRKQKRRQSAKK